MKVVCKGYRPVLLPIMSLICFNCLYPALLKKRKSMRNKPGSFVKKIITAFINLYKDSSIMSIRRAYVLKKIR